MVLPRPLPHLTRVPATEPACALCGRTGLPLTRHHLIPRSRHNKNKNKEQWGRQMLHHHLAMLCRACHRHIHAVLTEKELAASYTSIEALAAHPEIAKFAAWISTKPAGFQTMSRSMKRAG